jgi:ribonuclease R
MENKIMTTPLFPPPGKTPKEDTLAVMKYYKLPKAFPKAVLDEALEVSSWKITEREIKSSGRIDLRKKFIFTCDPVTARDYDDALSIAIDFKGNRTLGVHIADVSHYVRPGSKLDKEAFKRSTSVYLCDKVVPMLPEALSNGVCSLVPNEDRFAFSVFMTFDKSGKMIARRFAKSVIRSSRRFTYEQVMSIISASSRKKAVSEKVKAIATPKQIKAITEINKLSQLLRRERYKNGALDIEIPETEVVLDENSELQSLVTRQYDQSHQMIEECMVAANEAVAKELWTKGIKILSRLHENPDEEKLMVLRTELRGLGIKLGNIENQKVFAQFLSSIKKHPLYPTIAVMVLRSMKRACYDSETIGHFGLAKKYYAHFTSPIRRYPDLTLHRQLYARLCGKNAKMEPRKLRNLAEHTSKCEEVASEAERGLIEIKKYRLLQDQLSSRQLVTYEAIVVKCTSFGCFVDLPEIAVSGLVHVRELSHKFVRFNSYDATLSIPGGGSWKIGDKMNVKVLNVDMQQRRIDFAPVIPHRSRFKI